MLGIGETEMNEWKSKSKDKGYCEQFKTRREACVNYEANKDSLPIPIICDTFFNVTILRNCDADVAKPESYCI